MRLLKDATEIDWGKMQDLVPAVVQHEGTGEVLMVGYMNQEALEHTQRDGKVTFWSRSKERLWTKGESSGNHLELRKILVDCDADALVVKALPRGPTCHTGDRTCFGGDLPQGAAFLAELEAYLVERGKASPEESYTAKLLQKGVGRIAQKVGEEGLETALGAVDPAVSDEDFLGEAGDLLYHLLVLLQAKGFALDDAVEVLRQRHRR